MATTAGPEYTAVLRQITAWPRSARLALLRDVLDTLADQEEIVEMSTSRSRPALHEVAGLLKTDEPPPTDDQVEQWLEERRIQRFG
jgi:hypothetical protein